MPIVPSAQRIVNEVLRGNPDLDVNSLHEDAYRLMKQYRSTYYERRVDELLSDLDLAGDARERIKEKLLEPIVVDGTEYSNFMEEVSRRVSQAFQPISGSIAEICAQRELERAGLQKGVNFTRREERTDFTVYFPHIHDSKAKHRVEVKNVSLRERATRGLAFDGDSLFGFFNQLGEFTETSVRIFEELCIKQGGYCYIPPDILTQIPYPTRRFKPNTQFGNDMATFARTGTLP